MLAGYHYFEGSLIAAVALAVIALICRWVFSTDRPARPTPTESHDYGLLVAVTVVRTLDDAEMLREVLRDAGIRGTVTPAPDGYSVLVFRSDLGRARSLVRS